jgi:hypothetical protein
VPALHSYGEQEVKPCDWHVPLPLQVRALIRTEPKQKDDWQTVPAVQFRHPPAPSQVPSSPQVDLADVAHRPRGSAVPELSGRQVPRNELTLHDWQLPQTAETQHTPSVQYPLWHWLPDVQVRPSGRRLPQALPMQTFGDAH